MLDWNCSFACFDAVIEGIQDDNVSVYMCVKELEDNLKQVINNIYDEIDKMQDDRKEDHDNYDSIHRERNLRTMKERAVYLKRRINEILTENNIKIYLF